MDNAHQISSMYRPSRAVTTPAASWDGPSHPSSVFPYRLSVQSTGNTPQASSSKLTLDDVYLPGGSSQSSYSMPPNASSVSAHEFLMVDHAPATMAMQMNHAHLGPNPSASFDPPSPQPNISTKAAPVRMPIMKDETSNNVNLASEGAIPSDSQQAAAPQHGSGPIVLRETMNRMDLAPMASGVVPTVRPEQTSVPVMIDDMATEMNLLTANDMSPLPKTESGATAKTEAHDATTLDDFIPPQLPDEIAALVDAYVFGRPLSVMISRDRLKESWGVEVKKEFGYVMLGFFKILGLREIRVKSDNMKVSKLANGLCAGQVQWRFHLEWAPGGEEIILPDHPKDSFDWPWWNEKVKDATSSATFETSVSSEAETQETSPNDGAETEEPENRYPTTPRYRQVRIANHEYKFRNCPLSDAYDSVVPEQVLAPFGRQHSDRVLPRGWLCTKCGRLNFQQALRHRKCPSSSCKVSHLYSHLFVRDFQIETSCQLIAGRARTNRPVLLRLVLDPRPTRALASQLSTQYLPYGYQGLANKLERWDADICLLHQRELGCLHQTYLPRKRCGASETHVETHGPSTVDGPVTATHGG